MVDIRGGAATGSNNDETEHRPGAVAYMIDNNTRTILSNAPNNGPSEVIVPTGL
jgi:hypothetical protein